MQVSQESPTWSKKMIELLSSAELSVQSKYVLEKVKLKKILQTMHREINQADSALRLKGGIDTEVLAAQFSRLGAGNGGKPSELDPKQSVRMSQLLQSRTFLSAFSGQ